MKILAVNPGGYSTKIAVFQDETVLSDFNIVHSDEELAVYQRINDQLKYRENIILQAIRERDHTLESFDAFAGRGGLMKPVPGGVYAVNEVMCGDLAHCINGEHPSNLGAPLVRKFAAETGKPAFVVDPVSVDEFDDISRYTGISDISKASWLHALNHKAVCRQTAEDLGRSYEECNFIVAHLGSGISIAAHKKGAMVDGSGGRSDGPFSPERSGGLPAYALVELCYSGKYSHEEMIDKISKYSGMYDYFGTKDMLEIEKRYLAGDAEVIPVFNAFTYQVCKEIALYGATLYGDVDRIILTGSIARCVPLSEEVKKRTSFLAPVVVHPGEMEMKALALGALRVLQGKEEVKQYR